MPSLLCMLPLYLSLALSMSYSVAVADTHTKPSDADAPLNVTIKGKKRKAPKLSAYDRPAKQVAQSTVQINPNDFKILAADRLDDIADTIPGVLQDATNDQGSSLLIRGFPLNNAEVLDGLADVQGSFARDPATVESIEISKGRDSSVFGAGSLAGTVNAISKKPSFKRKRTATISTGTPQQTRVALDIDTPLNNNWASRVVAVGQMADTDYAHIGDDRYTIMPSLRWQEEKQSLLLQAEHTWQNRETGDRTIWYQGAPVYNVSYVDPRAQSNHRLNSATLAYERELSPQWQTKIQSRQLKASIQDQQISMLGNLPDTNQLLGYYKFTDRQRAQQIAKAELQHNQKSEHWQHNTTLGWQTQNINVTVKDKAIAGTFYLDIDNPQFDYPLPADDLPVDRAKVSVLERSTYLQHTTELNKQLTLNAGVRFSHYLGGVALPTISGQGINTRNTSRSLGTTWQFHPNWQAFASRIESYDPSFGWDRLGKLFPPEENRQSEIGLRYSRDTPLAKPLEAQLSTYRLKRNNALTLDPLDPKYSMAAGQQLSKGVEATLNAPLSKRLQLNMGYSYTNARLVQSNTYPSGNQLANTPQHSASAKLDYDLSPQTRLTINGVYIAKRPGDLANSFEVPSYTRWDGGLRHDIDKNTTVTLGIRNMLNKDYVASSLDQNLVVQGRKRGVMFGITSDF